MLDDFHNIVGNELAAIKVFGSMYNTMSYCGNFVHGLDNAVISVNQCVQYHLNSLNVSGHRIFNNEFACRGLMRKYRAVDTYSFAKSFCYNAFVFHIYELIFKRGASCVYNQNFHS